MSNRVKISDLKLRPPLEIMAEVAMLSRMAEGFDSERETQATVIAAGAHDALRWALGLAEEAPSDSLIGRSDIAEGQEGEERPVLENHIGKEAGTR